MARVNHKLVKQRLNEKRSKITDRQFFTSRLLGGYFEDLAAAQTKRYHYNRRVRVSLYWKPNEKFFAATNNQVILINAGYKMVTKIKGREERFELITGVFAHELGHVFYTDFPAGQTHLNRLATYKWFPYAPDLVTSADVRNEKEFWQYVKDDPKNLEMIQCLASNISNVIEDGYVENRMLNNFPGKLGVGLQVLRDIQFEQIPTVTQLIEKEDGEGIHIFESILQMLLSYAKFGEIKYGDEPLSDERIRTVFSLIDSIDNAILSRSAKERLDVVNLIMIRCWEYVQDFCEVCKKRQEDAAAAGGTSSVAETLSEMLQSIAGGSSAGEGTSTPVPEASGGNDESETAAARAKTKEDAEKSDEETGADGASQTETENDENPPESGGTSGSGNSGAEGGGIPPSTGGAATDGEKAETSATEKGRIPHHQTERISSPPGSGIRERNDEYEGSPYESAASDIERILDKMAEKAVCEQLENDRIRELNDVAQSISYGNAHEGINVRVNRIASVDESYEQLYDEIATPLLSISRQLQKSLIRQLKDNQRGGKQTGLIMGRRLDAHALPRNDGKVFYKNNLPNEIPELAVGLLLDESGSMCSSDRCTYARAAAIILHDFCESLGIPVMIYGHTTGSSYDGHCVELYSYAEFDGFDKDDKYRLMDISARNSNRDGAALRYVAENLSRRPETVKLLILVSDGQPADYGYSGTAAEEDLRGVKHEYQRKGIIFVAAAIGDDKQNIERIYGDSFLDISDLNQLPTKLTAVVKRHVRV